MKGLLRKDWYMTVKYFKSFVLLVVCFSIGGAAVSADSSLQAFYIYYPGVMAAAMTNSLIAYDEREKWHIYLQTLPVTRTQYVTGKYLYGISVAAVMSMIGAAAALLLRSDLSESMLGAAVCLLLQAVMLPPTFWLGAERGRVAYIVAFVVAAVVFMGFFALAKPAEIQANSVALLYPASLILYALSWRVSVTLYQRRDL